MFKKKECPRCKNKIGKKNNFCPYCGAQIQDNDEDWGMLGKNDFIEEKNLFENSLLNGFGGKIINKMFNNAMRMLEKEMQKNQEFPKQNSNSHFELFINGKRINPENIKVTRKPIQKENAKQKTIILPSFSSESQKKFAKSLKKEPKTNLRRLSDKVIYELEIPGINSIKDISIVKLENSIEIKAIAKKNAYQKLIPISLPITKYNIEKGKLTLELEAKD